jgi:hypothetical protein
MPRSRISIPTGRPPKPAIVILPPRESGERCPAGWSNYQEETMYAVYTETKPTIFIGNAVSLEDARKLAAGYRPG